MISDYCIHHSKGRDIDNLKYLYILKKTDHDNLSRNKITLEDIKDKIKIEDYINNYIDKLKNELSENNN